MNSSDTPLDRPAFAERPSRRRTNTQHGFVNFPLSSIDFVSSREGGMFVKLVVVDERDYDDSEWTICCGAAVFDRLSEQLVGDSEAALPALVLDGRDDTSPESTLALFDAHTAAANAWDARHFPDLHDATVDDSSRYTSRPYVASLLLGITGWSGYSAAQEAYWRCTLDDLTPEGKALHAQMQTLYPGCRIHLLTFLDT